MLFTKGWLTTWGSQIQNGRHLKLSLQCLAYNVSFYVVTIIDRLVAFVWKQTKNDILCSIAWQAIAKIISNKVYGTHFVFGTLTLSGMAWGYTFFLTFIEDKSTENKTYALNTHRSAENHWATNAVKWASVLLDELHPEVHGCTFYILGNNMEKMY